MEDSGDNMTSGIPKTQYAVQLTGPDTLALNTAKPVPQPGPHQLLCKVEAVGLCFSDLKLLKQFDAHPRKKEILSGIDPAILREIPSYVPGTLPTVPGHEAVVRIVAAGPDTRHKVGERALVQTDYRWLPTTGSNGSFGYDFEGGLQEYVLLDERVITSPEGESMLIPAEERLGASAIALVEPWACVEDAYVSAERTAARPGGRMLIVADPGHAIRGIEETFSPAGPPEWIACVLAEPVEVHIGCRGCEVFASLEELRGQTFDDAVYFGADAGTIEHLDRMLAPHGLLNVVLGGARIGKPVSISVGRVHYGGIRIVGTSSENAADSLGRIPPNPEIRSGEKILVIGAAGPMGVMHVIRNLCQGVPGIEVAGTDFDEQRLALLTEKAAPLARKNRLRYQSINPKENPQTPRASYTVLMAPVPALVAQAVEESLPNGIINIFAGIPAGVAQELNLDAYIEKGLYFIGTSGSVLADMRIVLRKVAQGSLDTNLSVGAVSGMKGAIEGIRAVENRTIAGKIIVYPMLHDLELTPLEDLAKKYPSVYAKLREGQWTREAEEELIADCGS
jgi:threonine dehydrogenase-like Zn-dependent dehydrogenase